MKGAQQFLAAALVLLIGGVHGASDAPATLNRAVEQGRLEIESVTGTGGSSGAVLDAVLVNAMPSAQRIRVYFDAPLFFRNRGAAQSMVATQVYGRDGSFWQQTDGVSYIEVAAGSHLPVTFVAYCADFDRDNPGAADTFDVVDVPQAIEKVMRKVTTYEAANRDVDVTAASQLALWVEQGHSLDTIGRKFPFTADDVVMLNEILSTPVDQAVGESTTGDVRP